MGNHKGFDNADKVDRLNLYEFRNPDSKEQELISRWTKCYYAHSVKFANTVALVCLILGMAMLLSIGKDVNTSIAYAVLGVIFVVIAICGYRYKTHERELLKECNNLKFLICDGTIEKINYEAISQDMMYPFAEFRTANGVLPDEYALAYNHRDVKEGHTGKIVVYGNSEIRIRIFTEEMLTDTMIKGAWHGI